MIPLSRSWRPPTHRVRPTWRRSSRVPSDGVPVATRHAGSKSCADTGGDDRQCEPPHVQGCRRATRMHVHAYKSEQRSERDEQQETRIRPVSPCRGCSERRRQQYHTDYNYACSVPEQGYPVLDGACKRACGCVGNSGTRGRVLGGSFSASPQTRVKHSLGSDVATTPQLMSRFPPVASISG